MSSWNSIFTALTILNQYLFIAIPEVSATEFLYWKPMHMKHCPFYLPPLFANHTGAGGFFHWNFCPEKSGAGTMLMQQNGFSLLLSNSGTSCSQNDPSLKQVWSGIKTRRFPFLEEEADSFFLWVNRYRNLVWSHSGWNWELFTFCFPPWGKNLSFTWEKVVLGLEILFEMRTKKVKLGRVITEPQNCSGGKGSLKIICPNSPAKADSVQ